MSHSITGPLRNWKLSDWKRATKYITKDDGTRYTPAALKDVFLLAHSKGEECFPIGDCDNFDPKTGCKGHPVTTESETP